MKNAKQELIEKIESLNDNSREIRQLNEYMNLISTEHKDTGFANTVKIVPTLISNITSLNPLAKGVLAKNEYYEIRDHITNTRNSLRVISDNIKSGKTMIVVPTTNEVTKKIVISLLEADKMLTSINAKISIAIAKGKTESAHGLIDSSQEYVSILKETSSILSKKLSEIKQTKEDKPVLKNTNKTTEKPETKEVKADDKTATAEKNAATVEPKEEVKKETPAQAKARKTRETKAAKAALKKEEPSKETEEAKEKPLAKTEPEAAKK